MLGRRLARALLLAVCVLFTVTRSVSAERPADEYDDFDAPLDPHGNGEDGEAGEKGDAWNWEEKAENGGLMAVLSNPQKLFQKTERYDVTKYSRGGKLHVAFCNS
jgi:hypothetical protein